MLGNHTHRSLCCYNLLSYEFKHQDLNNTHRLTCVFLYTNWHTRMYVYVNEKVPINTYTFIYMVSDIYSLVLISNIFHGHRSFIGSTNNVICAYVKVFTYIYVYVHMFASLSTPTSIENHKPFTGYG